MSFNIISFNVRSFNVVVYSVVYIATISDNYRPISLPSIFCKIMERIIASDMLNFFLKHKLIFKHQSWIPL